MAVCGIDAALHGVGEDALGEKHQGIRGLVLGGSSDVSMHRQVGQERFDLRCGGEEVLAGPHAVEPDEADDPRPRGAFGVHGGVVEAEHLADFIEEFGLLTSCCVRPIRSPSKRSEITDNRHRQNYSNIPLIS
jgi:hypothetical protein